MRVVLCNDFQQSIRDSCPRASKSPERLIVTCCGQCNYPCPKRCIIDLKHRFSDVEPEESPRKLKDWCLSANKKLQKKDTEHYNYGPVFLEGSKPDVLTGDLCYLPDTELCQFCKPFKPIDRRYRKNDTKTC